jgi:hypothetical protein
MAITNNVVPLVLPVPKCVRDRKDSTKVVVVLELSDWVKVHIAKSWTIRQPKNCLTLEKSYAFP